MKESKISSSYIGSDDEDYESQESQLTSVLRQAPKKRSKMQQLLIDLTNTQTELRVIARNLNLK